MNKFLFTSLENAVDINKGGIKIGNINITVDQLQGIIFKVLNIAITIFVMYLAIKVGNSIINKWAEKQGKLKFSIDSRKSKTIGALLKSILRYCVYFFGVVAILTQLKFLGNLSITFAGIGGVAIGFGAQNIVKDIFNGFFIIFEDQYSVGEYIEVENMSGIVESIELRVTRIRDFNGSLHIIPNGEISKVTNHSRGAIRIQVAVDIAYEEDIDNAMKIISNVCTKFSKDNKDVVEPPKVVGVTDLASSGVTIKVFGKVKPMTQWKCENDLRKQIKIGLDEAEVEIPYTKIQIPYSKVEIVKSSSN